MYKTVGKSGKRYEAPSAQFQFQFTLLGVFLPGGVLQQFHIHFLGRDLDVPDNAPAHKAVFDRCLQDLKYWKRSRHRIKPFHHKLLAKEKDKPLGSQKKQSCDMEMCVFGQKLTSWGCLCASTTAISTSLMFRY